MMQPITVIGLVIIFSYVSYCHVIETPRNVAVYAGRPVFFNCVTSNGSFVREWNFRRRLSDQTPVKIFLNWGDDSVLPTTDSKYGFSVDGDGSGRLYINDPQVEDAGLYTCTTEAETGIASYHAELIVLKLEPRCTVEEFSASRIKAECTANISGNWSPKMEWRHHQTGASFEAGTILDNELTINGNFTQRRVTSKITALVLKSGGKVSSSVSCKTYFDRGNETSSPGSASNVPSLVYIWNSSVSDSKNATFIVVSSQFEHKYLYLIVALSCAIVLIFGALTFAIHKRKRRTQQQSTGRQPVDVIAQDPSMVVYADVDRTRNHSNSRPLRIAPEERSHQSSGISVDGTVYLDVNNASCQFEFVPEPTIPRNAMFQKSEYASIDHTEKPHHPSKRP